VWGFFPITFLFIASQVPLIMKYEVKPDEGSQPTAAD
jgi:hypothetical protein